MKTFISSILILAVIVGAVVWFLGRDNSTTPTPNGNNGNGDYVTYNDLVRVSMPKPNETVTSPLTITGEARGNWYFEASFPIRLFDANGTEIGLTIAQAQGEWMTTEYVPFEARIVFTNPTTPTGTLVLEKDNASGLPEHDDEFRIPVRFSGTNERLQTVKLFYNTTSNNECSAENLASVERRIPVTITPIQDTIKLLLKGELSSLEEGTGITTEFPLDGLTLVSANLSNGVLTLNFNDPQNKTGGGSCRVTVLRAQIEATAKQFPGVREVRVMPEELFQP